MTNLDRYEEILSDILNVERSEVKEVKYQKTKIWDSVAHVRLIAAMEDAFDVMLDTEDVIGFSSYGTGMEILKKYQVDFEH